MLTKVERELRIFEALAPMIGYEVVPGSIQQPDPPQPDVLCEIVRVGPLAVELVAIDDPVTRTRINNMFGTRDAWNEAARQWAVPERLILDADLHDAHISAQFAEAAGIRDRTAALHALQMFLLARPRFSGDVGTEEIGAPRGFESARVFRGRMTRPGPWRTIA
jgi:hypothetical protein